jgi:hypothetical protein
VIIFLDSESVSLTAGLDWIESSVEVDRNHSKIMESKDETYLKAKKQYQPPSLRLVRNNHRLLLE